MTVILNPDKLKFSLIVAACNNMGIGKGGKLPWNLPKEMAFFKMMTSSTTYGSRTNAVVMGRNTWEGIPEEHRPLKNRINVIVSSTLDQATFGEPSFSVFGDEEPRRTPVKVCKSWESALDFLSSLEMSQELERIWIIGGSSLYEVAARSPHCEYIYLTRILADFDCDVFFPADEIGLEKNFCLHSDPVSLGVNPSVQTDKGVEFKYEVYCRRGSDAPNASGSGDAEPTRLDG